MPKCPIAVAASCLATTLATSALAATSVPITTTTLTLATAAVAVTALALAATPVATPLTTAALAAGSTVQRSLHARVARVRRICMPCAQLQSL